MIQIAGPDLDRAMTNRGAHRVQVSGKSVAIARVIMLESPAKSPRLATIPRLRARRRHNEKGRPVLAALRTRAATSRRQRLRRAASSS